MFSSLKNKTSIPVKKNTRLDKEEQINKITRQVMSSSRENPLVSTDSSEKMKKREEPRESRNAFEVTEEHFGVFWKFIQQDDITDIDYNGKGLWITNVNNQHIKIEDHDINERFIEQFAQWIANRVSKEFNQQNPVLEAETNTLRVSIVHKSIAVTGTSVCIRKTPPLARITERYALETNYASKDILSFLANCIKSHMNIIVCGEPRAGKTEFAKFLSQYIPDSERVITIEDVLEWRYAKLKPKSDCIEMKTTNKFQYPDAIKASLKQNPKWIMISETRGEEVRYLLQGFSTGVSGITTLHTDHVMKIPNRMTNMVQDSTMVEFINNNIYEFVDVGILVSIKYENGKSYRYIDQICLIYKDDEKKDIQMIVENGRIINRNINEISMKKFAHADVEDCFKNEKVEKRLIKQKYYQNCSQ